MTEDTDTETKTAEPSSLPAADIPQMKSQQRGSARIPYQAYYDAAAQRKVARRYKEAIALFGWTFE